MSAQPPMTRLDRPWHRPRAAWYAVRRLLRPPVRVDEQRRRLLRDAWWRGLVPALEQITVPALICGSFSDNNLHSRGSFRVWEGVSSSDRFLYTHRGRRYVPLEGSYGFGRDRVTTGGGRPGRHRPRSVRPPASGPGRPPRLVVPVIP
jgi:predicted acyl esterase